MTLPEGILFMKKRDIHLICNAHLDPVWLWQWQEGAAEALSAFRTAAELCEENDTFVFNHNEVILYQWIHEYDPALFKQIQKLVKKGRWHIMGGRYLQPDCNMPSGESFVRQILLGRLYFKKHFGVEPKTAINFDPFGHTRGLVQILAKSGYDSYLFGRPDNCLALAVKDFKWVGYDGSYVMATRFPGWYNTFLRNAAEIVSQRTKIGPDRNPMLILWGVGNGIFECVQDIVGYESLCMIAVDDPELYGLLFETVGKVSRGVWKRFLDSYADLFAVCRFGDDLGYKTSTLLSVQDIQRHIIPPYKGIVDIVHSSRKPFLLHSCGCIFDVMDQIIDGAGIDAKHSNEDAITPFEEWTKKIRRSVRQFRRD